MKGMSLKGARVAVHGFGNAGANIARLVAADGAKVVAVCDSKAGLYAESGIDIHGGAATQSEDQVAGGSAGSEGDVAGRHHRR